VLEHLSITEQIELFDASHEFKLAQTLILRKEKNLPTLASA